MEDPRAKGAPLFSGSHSATLQTLHSLSLSRLHSQTMAPPRAGRFVISLLLASASPSFAFAFAPPSTSSCRAEGARLLRSRALVDPSAAHEVVSWLHHAGGDFHLLADAAAVPADAAEVAKDAGWWDTYIGAFKTTIKGVDDFYRSNGVPGSFGWSIVTFTALIKTGLLPFQYFQLFSSERMKNLQPVQKQIKERYGNDKAREQYVVSKLFEQTKTNPVAGCIPSLLQIPIFIGLYRSLQELASDSAANESFLWLPNLQGPTFEATRGVAWLTQNWAHGAPSLGWHDTIAYCSVPLLLVLSQSISMRVLAPPVDSSDPSAAQTQQILKFLPLMIGWFSLNVASAMGVYWMTNNLLTTTYSYAIKTYLKINPPQIDIPEDLFDMPPTVFKYPSAEVSLLEAKVNAAPPRSRKRVA